MAKKAGAGGGKKNRKYGRNAVKCSAYAAQDRRTKNNPARTKREGNKTPHRGHIRQPALAPPKKSRRNRKDEDE